MGKRIAIVWPGFTGYMGDCWRALAKRHEVKVYVEPSHFEHSFDGSELEGLDWRRVESLDEMAHALKDIRLFSPDMTLISSWNSPLVRMVARSDLACRKVLAFDMPWEWSLRKLIARWALWPRLRYFDAAFVPGVRTLKYANWLGFRGHVVTGVDTSGWERFQDITPAEKGFVFVGRLSPEKGLDVLVEAYRKYRCVVMDPWPLDLVGDGDVEVGFSEGMGRIGFVMPEKIPEVMSRHAALILPSRRENWGIAALEAMSAGLVTIATDACGFTSDVKPTFLCAADDIDGLCEAMVVAHGMSKSEREEESIRARGCAERYSVAKWVDGLEGLLP